ncbi:amidohydrolase family protein [Halobium palmae]|uniref:Amidohydrolase family protein n=1 Tax=Halobium palmae TaxID=1776492 RepID=A0ABD5RW60_9EURY
MKPGRFVVDTHVHGQRHAVRLEQSATEAGYESISHVMRTATPADEASDDDDVIVYPNTDRIIHDMDSYGVDRCVLLPGFGMTNEIHQEMVQEYPERFTAMASPVQTDKAAARGEEEWTIERACEELDEVLQEEEFIGIGESAPTDPTRNERIEWSERRDELRQAFEVADAHNVPISWHSGTVSGYSDGKSSLDVYPDWEDPSLISELAAEYDNVDIIVNHGGMQGTWHEDTVDAACKVAARHDNVYLEIGLYWADLIQKPFNDPSIDISQLLWGTDWGASMVAHSQPTKDPPMYWDQIQSRGLPAHQPDYWGTSIRQLKKFVWDEELPQDEFNLILGGNACRLLDIEPPETRLFPEYL